MELSYQSQAFWRHTVLEVKIWTEDLAKVNQAVLDPIYLPGKGQVCHCHHAGCGRLLGRSCKEACQHRWIQAKEAVAKIKNANRVFGLGSFSGETSLDFIWGIQIFSRTMTWLLLQRRSLRFTGHGWSTQCLTQNRPCLPTRFALDTHTHTPLEIRQVLWIFGCGQTRRPRERTLRSLQHMERIPSQKVCCLKQNVPQLCRFGTV